MSAAIWIGIVGLSLNMVGVIFAFIWGHPQPDHDTSVSVGIGGLPEEHIMSTGETYREWLKRKRDQKARFTILSRTGLSLMFLGFGFQIVALTMTS